MQEIKKLPRPRGKTKKLDNKYAKDLLKDQKEIAEHLMLLDLGRNDVGRSKKSSVKVTQNLKSKDIHM